jgi:hypothetical protein
MPGVDPATFAINAFDAAVDVETSPAQSLTAEGPLACYTTASCPAIAPACARVRTVRIALRAMRGGRIVGVTVRRGRRIVARAHGRALRFVRVRIPEHAVTLRIVTVSHRGFGAQRGGDTVKAAARREPDPAPCPAKGHDRFHQTLASLSLRFSGIFFPDMRSPPRAQARRGCRHHHLGLYDASAPVPSSVKRERASWRPGRPSPSSWSSPRSSSVDRSRRSDDSPECPAGKAPQSA